MSNSKDAFGDRMKMFEGAESLRRFMPYLPVIARMDGRSFHNFTKGMNRPYDQWFSHIMLKTTMYLVEETGALVGYTQSDEITLAWYSKDIKSQIFFDGKVMKMTSNLASLTTLRFNQLVLEYLPTYAKRNPIFDARVWQVPNLVEATNAFLWREMDATKNSISMAAHSVYSTKELHGKNGSQKQEMLFQKGINWNEYPSFFKRGTYVQKRTTTREFTSDEIEELPAKHAARKNPNLIIERSEVRCLNLPPLNTIANRTKVLFEGADPIENDN